MENQVGASGGASGAYNDTIYLAHLRLTVAERNIVRMWSFSVLLFASESLP
jgi:hypothetical protein